MTNEEKQVIKTNNLLKPFRYSGNKIRLIKYYRQPPSKTSRIIEPFAGSMSYAMQFDTKVLGIEKDKRIYDLWKWLSNVDESELDNLYSYFNSLPNFTDVNTLDCSEVWKSYMRINSGSMMTGHIDKNILYIETKPLPLEKTKLCLNKIKEDVTIINEDCRNFNFTINKETDLVFVDPPYLKSGNSYGTYDLTTSDIVELIEKFSCPVIFTYDETAIDDFPMYKWEFVKEVINSKSRPNSSKRVRQEMVTYINWE